MVNFKACLGYKNIPVNLDDAPRWNGKRIDKEIGLMSARSAHRWKKKQLKCHRESVSVRTDLSSVELNILADLSRLIVTAASSFATCNVPGTKNGQQVGQYA